MELTPTGDEGGYSMDILLELEETTPKTDYLDANKYQEGLTPNKLKDVDMSQQVLITNETNESEDAFKIPEAAKKISVESGREELVLINDVLLFLPINIKDTHWYLAVVNARRRKIHGLRMQMQYTLQCTGLKDHAWPDVNVDTWDVVEESMVKFRTKMAATLLSTIFNERLGKPLLRNEDENIGSLSDFAEIIEPKEFQQIKQKRKSTNNHENALKPKKIDTEIDSDKQDVLLYYKD
ncbi:hypothetical protein SETIT_8G053800v2 [Setaria italica]|uniref:Ubiquitin-like protease family profile domain-containing protein n=1 Tax=Setaria italica TaxID=4555 RepID=K3ZMQ3_SETIT|nr:hypothetical protein SETIT_8G053800v2 [Setaria italica]